MVHGNTTIAARRISTFLGLNFMFGEYHSDAQVESSTAEFKADLLDARAPPGGPMTDTTSQVVREMLQRRVGSGRVKDVPQSPGPRTETGSRLGGD